MRVAYLINQYPKVSHSFIRREIQALEKLGLEITRISIRGWDEELADENDRNERKKTRYVLCGGARVLLRAVLGMLFRRPGRLFGAMCMAWRMSRLAERPLLVHLVYVAEACRIEPWLRKAGVEHVHAHFGTNSAEVAMLVHALDGPRWSFTVHGPKEFEKVKLIHLAEKVHDSAFVVAISSYGRSQLYRVAKPDEWRKVEVVRCGLDESYLGRDWDALTSSKQFVCVGRLCEQKGQLLLVEAARRLALQRPDFRLVLGGDGEMRGDIEALIARHGLGGVVRITGWISSEQVRQEIRAARALVLPSLAEGLPVVLMEAMALRRPVISTYVAGIPELVTSGEHGWLVPAGDVDALVEAMQKCLDAPDDVLARMGDSARKRVLLRHNVDDEAKKLATLFRDQASALAV